MKIGYSPTTKLYGRRIPMTPPGESCWASSNIASEFRRSSFGALRVGGVCTFVLYRRTILASKSDPVPWFFATLLRDARLAMLGRVTVIGCGLIGGSIVKALRNKQATAHLSAIDGDEVIAAAGPL